MNYLNLGHRDWQGPMGYNQEAFNYILKHGKPITEIPTERDTANPNVSPLIAFIHVPSGKICAFKAWFWFPNGEPFIAISEIRVKPNNPDFLYILESDDPREHKYDIETYKVYHQDFLNITSKYTSFKTDKLDTEFNTNKDTFDANLTEEETNSDWYKRYIELAT